jgi:hypothetical protein
MKRIALLFAVVLFVVYLAGEVAKTGKTLAFSAGKASGLVNSHQLELALEMYNSEKGFYPQASGGVQLLEILQSEGYLEKIPASLEDFGYFVSKEGDNYELFQKGL